MEGKNNEYKAEFSNIERLNERLKLTLAFSKRLQLSTAVCYLRFHIPLELLHQKDVEIETILMSKMITRLNRSIRDIDTIIRVNRTDFILVIADITEDDCRVICERIIQACSERYTVDFHHVSITSNIGICMYPYGAEEPHTLKETAKVQMMEAEKSGENCFSFFNGELNEAAYRKMLIENDLPYALKKGQLYVQYQPQYHLGQRRIIGVEALIRWHHPDLGEISPAEFINYAEETGIGNSLFYWVFETVCQQIASEQNVPLKYSINLSVNQLLLDSLLLRISNLLSQYAVSASQLTLEITENIEVYTVKDVNERLYSLKEMGFTIALDDFGNGYFSISDFLKLPIDYLKLDRNFVFSLLKNKNHVGVISPIIQMAHNLNVQVIIEGIEDAQQYREWKNLNCDIIQGYFISRPLSSVVLTASIAKIEARVEEKS
ncbi:putative bifunctional diguanylate cyclase/phosphodiesterase [Neobacillus jeddahensis]|uniref:putative bifunctional diguanylate cyclase/phosphodiesterase n=1 Tax=Neobacillus jeddahensis TaxID=1461580 RepID=UPI00058B5C23|nr:bifunctional diguanylate cyclase/phosphodiesterase [Neobacillus jeddahensis]